MKKTFFALITATLAINTVCWACITIILIFRSSKLTPNLIVIEFLSICFTFILGYLTQLIYRKYMKNTIKTSKNILDESPEHKNPEIILIKNNSSQLRLHDNNNSSGDYDSNKINDDEVLKLIESSYNLELNRQLTSLNPKFHRTAHEDELSFKFSQNHDNKIMKYESLLYENANPQGYDIDYIIESYRKAINVFNQFKKYCYKTKGGTIYFQDQWEYCHNTRNECFSYIAPIIKSLDNLTQNYENEKNKLEKRKKMKDFKQIAQTEVLSVISEHEGILQKDLYSHFDKDLLSTVKTTLNHLYTSGKIRKEKYKTTYQLYLRN